MSDIDIHKTDQTSAVKTLLVLAVNSAHARAWITAVEIPPGTRAMYTADAIHVIGRSPATTRYICLDGWRASDTAHRAFAAIKQRGIAVWSQNGCT